ncbi:hypothetical protein EV426DRAFT_706093 [Tirmania nivea]|nr:hypothetical protein EV426DRAFT_706093 [Tirmania nivea]
MRAFGDYTLYSYIIYDARGVPHEVVPQDRGRIGPLPEVILNPDKKLPYTDLTEAEKEEITLASGRMDAIINRIVAEAESQAQEWETDGSEEDLEEDADSLLDEDGNDTDEDSFHTTVSFIVLAFSTRPGIRAYSVPNQQNSEDEILDFIRVAHSGLKLSQVALRTQFIDPPTEIVEDPVSDIENEILATYLPNEANEPEAEALLVLPPPVTLQAALADIEGLLLFSFQAEPTANIRDLQDVLQRENKVLRLWKFNAGVCMFSAGSLTFWCLPEVPPLPPLLDIPVSMPTLVWIFLVYILCLYS